MQVRSGVGLVEKLFCHALANRRFVSLAPILPQAMSMPGSKLKQVIGSHRDRDLLALIDFDDGESFDLHHSSTPRSYASHSEQIAKTEGRGSPGIASVVPGPFISYNEAPMWTILSRRIRVMLSRISSFRAL